MSGGVPPPLPPLESNGCTFPWEACPPAPLGAGDSVIGRTWPAPLEEIAAAKIGVDIGAATLAVVAWEPNMVFRTFPPERGDAPGDAWGRGFTIGIFASDGDDGVASVTNPPARGCAGLVWAVVAEMAAKAAEPRLPAVVPDGETGLAFRDRLGRAMV